MKKTLRNGKTLVWMLGAVALMGGFSAQAATVGDLLMLASHLNQSAKFQSRPLVVKLATGVSSFGEMRLTT